MDAGPGWRAHERRADRRLALRVCASWQAPVAPAHGWIARMSLPGCVALVNRELCEIKKYS
jgi:hypothetical protein